MSCFYKKWKTQLNFCILYSCVAGSASLYFNATYIAILGLNSIIQESEVHSQLSTHSFFFIFEMGRNAKCQFYCLKVLTKKGKNNSEYEHEKCLFNNNIRKMFFRETTDRKTVSNYLIK